MEYKKCYKNLVAEMREGNEVDLSTACAPETKALQSATEKAVNFYKGNTSLAVIDKKQKMYTPLVPYFQNF